MGAKKKGTGVTDATGKMLGIARHDLHVLGGNAVGQGRGLLERCKDDHRTELAPARRGNVATGQAGELTFDLTFDDRGEGGIVGHQNGLRGGIVLGLRQQVGGQPSGVVLPIGDMSTNFPSAEWKGKSQQGNFSDSMMELDANVGKVLQAVRDAGIEKDTIVVFSSDNGPWVDAWPAAGYGPFRGAKGTPLENGWRVPGLIWALGRIQAGTVLHGMMSYISLAHDCRDGGPQATVEQ